ncbi:MAG: isochorismatase family cysteine hydrolase [Woeseiaceae bacterium]|nr:isochorismatase family cysteine hydrolase [Woeseiaceae bacterium]
MIKESRNWDAFALVLIDVQKDFWKERMSQDLADYEKNLTQLLHLCRHEGIDVVHLRARFQSDESDWMVRYKSLGRIPCIEGTPGVEIFPFAAEKAGEFVIYKQSFDGFHKPALQAYLEKNGKRYLLLAGLVTSVCVLLTAASAAQRGFLVGIVDDCCADSPEAHEQTIQGYPFIFDRISVEQIIDCHDTWLADIGNLSKQKSD